MATDEVCEACRSRPVEILVDSSEPEQPYRVCWTCARRLDRLSLRPLEWFNLSAVHGPNSFLLHDDFYNEVGMAMQPQEPVREKRRFPAPKLNEVINDLERLLDYAIAAD